MEPDMLGSGRTAEVYAQGNGQVLKLFKNFMSRQAVEQEFSACREAYAAGIATPEPISLVEKDGRWGIVFQRIAGPSVLNYLSANPLKIVAEAKHLGRLHSEIHGVEAPGRLPEQKQRIIDRINRTELLTSDKKAAIIEYLGRLPGGDRLWHGDFHPDNILKNKSYWIIDWVTCTRGSPACDLARSKLIMESSALPDNIPFMRRIALGLLRKVFLRVYVNACRRLNGIGKSELEAWRLPLCAARLAENNPPAEERYLLREIGIRLVRMNAHPDFTAFS